MCTYFVAHLYNNTKPYTRMHTNKCEYAKSIALHDFNGTILFAKKTFFAIFRINEIITAIIIIFIGLFFPRFVIAITVVSIMIIIIRALFARTVCLCVSHGMIYTHFSIQFRNDSNDISNRSKYSRCCVSMFAPFFVSFFCYSSLLSVVIKIALARLFILQRPNRPKWIEEQLKCIAIHYRNACRSSKLNYLFSIDINFTIRSTTKYHYKHHIHIFLFMIRWSIINANLINVVLNINRQIWFSSICVSFIIDWNDRCTKVSSHI